ncbi:MAG: class I SAM-dependent methyltransferase [Candidatus Poribacteria bacterium]|nr:class I SAM-dependent methyltransferase [Candidatus Poribacteria bacterium]
MPHDWDSPEYVRQWIADGDKADAQRADQIKLLASLIQCRSQECIHVLDLGAGYGIVTREILTAYPNATVVCLDRSAEMLKHGKERLADNLSQLDFVQANFDTSDWLTPLQENQCFDAVLSSRAIHHVVDERKQRLYEEVFHLLKPGGCFANHDLVRHPDEPVRDSGNPLGTLEDQIRWLSEIGFVNVQCFWRDGGRAVFGGYKPASA